ncbi:hypothetical protein GCM10010289_79530 [Streptomyces violascens]|nr:hypothetical protein GCM10010289_79530 [Streptomyces violascens]
MGREPFEETFLLGVAQAAYPAALGNLHLVQDPLGAYFADVGERFEQRPDRQFADRFGGAVQHVAQRHLSVLERLFHGCALLAGGGCLLEHGPALLEGQRGQCHGVVLSSCGNRAGSS